MEDGYASFIGGDRNDGQTLRRQVIPGQDEGLHAFVDQGVGRDADIGHLGKACGFDCDAVSLGDSRDPVNAPATAVFAGIKHGADHRQLGKLNLEQ